MNISKKHTIWFYILTLLFFLLSFLLFYNQAWAVGDYFPSDMYCYVDYVNGQKTALITYPLFFWLAEAFTVFLPAQAAVAFVLAVLNTLTVYMIHGLFQKYMKKASLLSMDLLAIVLCFITPLYLPVFNVNLYLGQWSPNPWQNATTLAMRPFAVLTFYFFLTLWDEFPGKLKVKSLTAFSFSLFLSTLTKPSFTFVFLPASGILVLFDYLFLQFKKFKNLMMIGCSTIPTLLLLLQQYFKTFQSQNAGGGISFAFGITWKHYSPNVIVSILLAAAFPIIIFIFHFKDIITFKNKIGFLAYTMFAVGTAEAYFLNEQGMRQYDGNFIWPYSNALFFVFAYSIILWHSMGKSWKKNIGSVLLSLHIITGCLYFIRIFMGYSYY